MKRPIALVLSAAVLLAVGASAPAWAREAKGKIKTYETVTRVVTLEDGSQFVVTDKVKTVEKIKEGKMVKLTYEEQDGRNMVSEIDEVESP